MINPCKCFAWETCLGPADIVCLANTKQPKSTVDVANADLKLSSFTVCVLKADLPAREQERKNSGILRGGCMRRTADVDMTDINFR